MLLQPKVRRQLETRFLFGRSSVSGLTYSCSANLHFVPEYGVKHENLGHVRLPRLTSGSRGAPAIPYLRRWQAIFRKAASALWRGIR